MATNSYVSLAVPAGNGSGAGSNVSTLASNKTVQVSGVFSGVLQIEASNDGGTTWTSLMTIIAPGKRRINAACGVMRVTRVGVDSLAPGSAVVNIAAEITTSLQTASLNVPGTNTAGASTDITSFGSFNTVFVDTSNFQGALLIEVSEDGGTTWSVAMIFTGAGHQTRTFTGGLIRVRRSGIDPIAPAGTPVVTLGALPDESEASGTSVSGPGSSTDNALARWDGTTGSLIQDSASTLSDTGDLYINTLTLTGAVPSVGVSGAAANIDLNLIAKGTGKVYTAFDLGIKAGKNLYLDGDAATPNTYLTSDGDYISFVSAGVACMKIDSSLSSDQVVQITKGLLITASLNFSYTGVKTANYTIQATDPSVVQFDSSGAATITDVKLPTAVAGDIRTVHDVGGDTVASPVTVSANTGDAIPAGTVTIDQPYGSVTLRALDATNWYIVGGQGYTVA